MKLFKSKAEKEQERRMLVKKSMKELEKRIRKLKEQESVYINAARIAQRENLPEQLKLAKDALKMTISEEKRTYQMLLNAQVISQMKDMTSMTSEFLNTVHVISKSIAGTTSADVNKLSNELKLAMNKVADQTENLSEMMADAQDDVSDFSSDASLVSDDEIDKMIFSNNADSSIDEELEKLKRQLDNN